VNWHPELPPLKWILASRHPGPHVRVYFTGGSVLCGLAMLYDFTPNASPGEDLYNVRPITTGATASFSPPPAGTPIPCRTCGGPTTAFGGDLYDCKDKKCAALTYAATNPGNPAWWPVIGSSFRQARVDRIDRYAGQDRGGVVPGVDRG